MREGGHTDKASSEEVVVYCGAGIMGAKIKVRWHQKYGTVYIAYELHDGTRLSSSDALTPDITKKELGKSRFRLFLDNLLDKLF